ncbi:PREDICTED: F-box/kelch-repeat protein At5g51250-like [Camelina sativa]|uniref:F-box/kelch-repeat protein At5g51250-like n=1 Tax=Camelina sativa TaxID=90675 RepID=A0ABM0XRA4_CAMSA|nr:PREDICTED: F-box/kelch-repeat protein At5g51250-like [Camelina sativa]
MKTRMRKKQLSSTAKSSNPSQSLPNDLVLIIVARVSVLYYPALSLVSKSFRSLLASPELYKVRSLLGHTEICLYVCLKMKPYKTHTWFTLCRKPDRTLTSSKERRSGFRQRVNQSSHLDNTACIDGKFNVVTSAKVVAYDPKEGRWDPGLVPISKHMHSDSSCEIDNVLYSAADGALRWFDSQVRQWRDLKGLVGLSRLSPVDQVRLADYGGKMAVMWGVEVPCGSDYPTIICCAVIALERLNSCEIFGKVEWVDRVFTVFGPFTFVKVVAATV